MTNHPPADAKIIDLFEAIREAFKNAAAMVACLTPETREQSMAMTHLETALMWAVAAIARNQDEVLDTLDERVGIWNTLVARVEQHQEASDGNE